jgi:pyruvate ferredoxin oxidoreductase alpha subunit
MLQRDMGWISLFVDNGQEAVDLFIQAFKIAEHRDVLLPINVNMDGFQLTHVVEPIDFPTQSQVDKFLPPYKPAASVHPDKPLTMGTLGLPEIYTEACKARDEALVNSKKVIFQVWKEWEKMFGRKYEPVESYKTAGADVLLLTMGSMGETAEVAIDALRSEGVKAGLLKLRMWRPFPYDELKKAVKGAKTLVVTDRAISYGGPGGPACSEVRAALYGEEKHPDILNYIIGLGGRDVKVEDFINMVKLSLKPVKSRPTYEIYGVRE